MATTTTNYSLTLPTVGAETDAWGAQINQNFVDIDATLATLSTSDNSTPVTFANSSYDYLTLSGQQITLSAVDLTTDTSGTLPLSSGGTGANSATSAIANLLPVYAGAAGKVLSVKSTADGVEWIPVGGTGTVTQVAVSGANGITVSGSPVTASGTISLGISLGANLTFNTSTSQIDATNTTYSTATTSADGLMSSADKTKLDGLTVTADPVVMAIALG